MDILEISQESIQFILDRIAVINSEMGGIEMKVATLQADVEWLKWIVQLTLGAVVLGIIGTFYNIVLHKKNGKK